MAPSQAIKKAVGSMVKEMGEEVAQEYSQAIGDNYMKFTTDAKFKQDHVLPTMQEFKETAILTALATGVGSSAGALKIARNPSLMEKSAWWNAAMDPESFNNSVDKAILNGTLTADKGGELKQSVAQYKTVADALTKQGYGDNAVARMSLDAIRSQKLDKELEPIKGVSALAPVKEGIEKAKSEVEGSVRDASLGIPEMGEVLSKDEVAEKMSEAGGERKVNKLGEGDYKFEEVDLDKLYKDNDRFRNYIDEGKLKPHKDQEGVRMPVVMNADGSIVDGINRLAQQYTDGETTGRAFIQIEETPEPEVITQPKEQEAVPEVISSPEPEEARSETIPITQTTEINAPEIESPSKMDGRQQARNGERVGEQNSPPEVSAPESIKEEVSSKKEEVRAVPNKAVPEPVIEGVTKNKVAESKATRDASLERLKKAWQGYGKLGIINNPEENLKRDKEFYGALVTHIKNELLYRINTVKGFVKGNQAKMRKIILKDLAKAGIPVKDASILNKAFDEAYGDTKKIPGVINEEIKSVSNRQYYKDKIMARIKGREAGIKQGTKAGKTEAIDNIKNTVATTKKGVLDVLKEAKGKVSRMQLKTIVSSFDKVINSANKKDPAKVQKTIDNAISTAAQVAFEVNHARDIAVVRKTIKSLKSLKRNKGMVQQDIQWIASSQFPSPSKVNDLDTYKAMLNDYVASRKGDKTDAEYTKEEISEFIDAQNEEIYKDKMRKIDDELEELKADGQIPDDVTRDEYIAMLENNVPEKLKEFKSLKDEILKKDLKGRLGMLKDRLDEFEGYDKTIATKLSKVDPSMLSSIELRVLNNVLNNIAEYGTLDRAGQIINSYESAKIVEAMKNSKTRLRILPDQATLNKNTLSNTMSSLFFNNDAIAEFRSKTLGPVEQVVSREVRIPAHKNSVELTNIYKKHNLSSISNKKLSQFAFLNQWMNVDEGRIADELTNALDKRVDDLNYLFNQAQRRSKNERKTLIQDIKDNLKAMESLGLITYNITDDALDIKINNGLFDADNPTGTLKDMWGKMSTGEKEAYTHAINKFKGTVDGVEDYARLYEGKNFERIPGGEYFPRTPLHKHHAIEMSTGELNLDSDFAGNMKSLNKKPERLLNDRAKKFNKDVFYGTDFYSDAINNYWKSLYTSKAMPEIQKLDKILRNEDFKNFLTGKFDESFGKRDRVNDQNKLTTEGESNYDKFKKQLVDAVNTEKYAPFYSGKMRVLDEIISRSIKGALGNIRQAPKQYGPALLNNLILNKLGPTMEAVKSRGLAIWDKDYRDARQKLLSNFTGVQRSVQGNQAYDKGFKGIDQSKSWWQYPLDWQSKLQEISSIPLESADRAAQNDAYIASYISALIREGTIKSASDFDIYKEAENPNSKAIARAEQTAAEINNESAKGYRPAVIKDPAGMARYLWLLQSFNLNAYRFAKQKARIAFGLEGKVSSLERRQALAHVGGYAAQIFAYNILSSGLRVGELTIGYALIKALFDIDKEELTDKQKEDKRIKEFIKSGANIASDMFLGGLPATAKAGIQIAVNKAYQGWAAKQLADKRAASDVKIDANGTYLSKYFTPYFTGDNLQGAPAFYYNLYEKGLDLVNKQPPGENASEEDKALYSLSKYVAPAVSTLALGDFIIFERAMENALRQNKTAKKGKK